MNSTKIIRSPKILIPLLAMLAILTVSMPRNGEFEYHYRKGGNWNYETLVAPFSFPILKTQEQILQEKERMGSVYVPYYKFQQNVFKEVSDNIDNVLGLDYPELSHNIINKLEKFYDRGVLPEHQAMLGMEADRSQEVVFVQKSKRASKMAMEELYTIGDLREEIIAEIASEMPEIEAEAMYNDFSLHSILRPNLEFDRQTTELVHKESAEFISPTSGTFPAGDVIVSTGEIITSDIAQILDSFRAEFEETVGYSGPNYLLWLGNFGIALILCILVFTLIFFTHENSLKHSNEFLFIITIFVIACEVAFFSSRFPSVACYLIPYPAFALYYIGFFRNRFVLPLYVLCLLPVLFFMQNGTEMFITFLFSGFIGVFVFEHFSRGWRQFVYAFIIFCSTLLSTLIFRLFNGSIVIFDFTEVGYMALGALFCVAVYPLTYLFEIIFNLMSANRLVELTDTSRALLRELADKTPGTFQHSLAVMNMADVAARSVDANVPLIRAAALYHDIGKIMNPMCFVENQSPGVKYHDLLTPKESAQDIIRHVQDGLTLAEKYGVPKILRDFITTHHGTTTAGYFWTKYLNEGGNPADIAMFTYPGPAPRSKEQAIIMFCDTLEAASRTLDDFSAEKVSAFVDSIYESKFNAGQFNDAEITLHELGVVKETLKNYIVQVHHGRIAYPKRRKK